MFFVDDLDGLKDETVIKAALPREARVIIYSTRDPSILRSLQRDSEEHKVSNMDVDEMASLMNKLLNQPKACSSSDLEISEVELEAVARVVNGHVLAACRAISYIIHVLSQTNTGIGSGICKDVQRARLEVQKSFSTLQAQVRFVYYGYLCYFDGSSTHAQNHSKQIS